MVRNYYTLNHIARELNTLAGWVADECFTQDKDTLVLRMNDGKRECFIILVADGKYDSLYLKNSFGKARRNSVNLLPDLEGDILQSVEVIDRSRVVALKFLHTTAYAVLFGGVYSNFVILNSDLLVLDAFKKNQVLIGKPFEIPKQEELMPQDFPPHTAIKSALASSVYLFGNTYASEVFSRIKQRVEFKGIDINPMSTIAELSNKEINYVLEIANELQNEIINSDKFYLLENSAAKKLMSPINLNGLKLLSVYDTASEAVHRKIVSDLVDGEFKSEYTKIKNYLEKQERKLVKAIEIMEDFDSAKKREESYRLWAEILMSTPNCKNKHGESILLNDWNGNEILIKLDPKLNLLDNAKKYFDKAHSTQQELEIRSKRLPELKSKYSVIKEQLENLQKVNKIKELEKFEVGIKQATGQRVNSKKMTMEEKFRRFELGDGYILFAGKNASNNDELTLKFANPNDIWLHARGTSGSHTIIRMDVEEKPPKHILQKAAEITAYYSGARNAKYVPVIWTYKKYVRKPKGANVGAVVVSKETVMMAEPKLPE